MLTGWAASFLAAHSSCFFSFKPPVFRQQRGNKSPSRHRGRRRRLYRAYGTAYRSGFRQSTFSLTRPSGQYFDLPPKAPPHSEVDQDFAAGICAFTLPKIRNSLNLNTDRLPVRHVHPSPSPAGTGCDLGTCRDFATDSGASATMTAAFVARSRSAYRSPMMWTGHCTAKPGASA